MSCHSMQLSPANIICNRGNATHSDGNWLWYHKKSKLQRAMKLNLLLASESCFSMLEQRARPSRRSRCHEWTHATLITCDSCCGLLSKVSKLIICVSKCASLPSAPPPNQKNPLQCLCVCHSHHGVRCWVRPFPPAALYDLLKVLAARPSPIPQPLHAAVATMTITAPQESGARPPPSCSA